MSSPSAALPGSPASQTTDENEELPSAPHDDGAWGHLVRADGELALRLCDAQHSVGRSAGDLVIRDTRASSLHARVHREGPAIEDCSTNGLWVDGVRVGRGQFRPLGERAQLCFGHAPAAAGDQLRFSFVACAGAAPDAEASQGRAAGVATAAPVTPPGSPSVAAGAAGPSAAGTPSAGGAFAEAGGVSNDDHISCGICHEVLPQTRGIRISIS